MLDWKDIEIFHVVNNIIARVSNRSFVGLNSCLSFGFPLRGRNPEFIKLAIGFTERAAMAGVDLRFLPPFLRS